MLSYFINLSPEEAYNFSTPSPQEAYKKKRRGVGWGGEGWANSGIGLPIFTSRISMFTGGSGGLINGGELLICVTFRWESY